MLRTVKIYSLILLMFFLVWISVPIFNDSLQLHSEVSVSKTENRVLARKPLVNLNLLDPYPSAYEKYFDDHFFFRQNLLKAHSFLNLFLFNRSPIPDQVEIGKDGWLFNVNDEKKIYQGKRNLSRDSIDAIVGILHTRTLYYKGKGIHFYVCFAPMTQEIYPEFLPNNCFRSLHGTQTDNITAAIKRDSIIPFIDLKTALIDAKKYGRLYQKTDNHWNRKGAFFVYQAIISRIKNDFTQLRPISIADITFKPFIRHAGNLASAIGFDEALKELDYDASIRNAKAVFIPKSGYPPPYWFAYKNEYEIDSKTPDQSLPKIFVVRDSFFNLPMIFLRENFSKTVAIWDAWMYRANKDLIDKEKPDIVLLMIYEPHIPKILIAPSE